MLKKFLKKIDLIDIFIAFVFASILLTIFLNFFMNGTYLKNIHHDFRFIEDHSRHIIGMTDKDNYPDIWLVFPPFAYLIYSFFLKSDTTIFSGMNYKNISIDTYHIYYFFVCVQIVIFSLLLNEIFYKFNFKKRLLLILSLVFSYPLYYATVYQGNNILTVTLLLLASMIIINGDEIHLFTSGSIGKFWSMIFISIAFGLKLVPAIFGIEFIRKKEYKNAIILAAFGICIFALPFIYFDGINTFLKYINVLNNQNSGVQATSIYYYFNIIFKLIAHQNLMDNAFLLRSFQIVFLIITLILYFIANKNWKRMTILSFICYAFIPRSYIYYILYYLIPLVFFLIEENKPITVIASNKPIYILYTIIFIGIFSMYIFHYTEGVHFVFSIILIFVLSIEIICDKFSHSISQAN